MIGFAMGCSLPIDTVRIDSRDEPTRGVRYGLIRPVYKLGLRVPDQIGATRVRRVSDLPGSIGLATGPLWVPDAQPWGRMWLFPDSFEQDPPACAGYVRCADGAPQPSDPCARARASLCFLPDTQSHLAFTLSTELGSEAIYEVRGRTGFGRLAHLFSDTNVSIVLDDSGKLASISAGETDKTLEVIAMLAGVATKAAALVEEPMSPLEKGAQAGEGKECNLFPLDERFAAYVQMHGTVHDRIDELRAAQLRLRALMAKSGPSEVKAVMESLKLLEEQRTALETAEKTIQYNLPAYAYTIQIASRVPDTRQARWSVGGGHPVPLPPWITVTFKPKPFSQTAPVAAHVEETR
jgi:hypothetical protein